MKIGRRHFLQLSGAAAAAIAIGAPEVSAAEVALPQARERFDDPDGALHLLNRLTWGVRPEELQYARSIGLEAYLEEQLNPARIDDSATDALMADIVHWRMDRRGLYRMQDYEGRVEQALVKTLIIRATHSKRQLYERMVEFWSDHFNMPADVDYVPDLLLYHRDVLRRHALGNFRDLLLGTTRSPAMLYYLDNFNNVAEHPNENFARELLELYTLGVDGGYTEQDVKEVARAFTGWTVEDGLSEGFYFDPTTHDFGEKQVLGHTLPPNRGIEDGLHVLSIVANHPATARFVCRKLCVRFVSDDPPQELVESAAAVWQQSGGEIVPVLRHIFTSEAFRQSVGQKLRRPFDFFIGTLRATGTQVQLMDYDSLSELLMLTGQPPYRWHPPNGYPDVAGAWASTGVLLARWNLAVRLTHEAYSVPEAYIPTELAQRVGQPSTVGELVDAVARQVFGTALPPTARETFIAYAADGGGAETPVTAYLRSQKLGMLYALMLSSPLYQWR